MSRRSSLCRVLLTMTLVGCTIAAPRRGGLEDHHQDSAPALSLISPRRRNSEEVGSPSELAWQAWLLLDPQNAQSGAQSSALDSASLLRRITPKSVFIAPQLQACAEGYQADAMGRCVKNVNINQEEHLNFLLQQLNAMYGNSQPADALPLSQPSDSSQQSHQASNSSSIASGPLQLSIPLFPSSSSSNESKDQQAKEPFQVSSENSKPSSIDQDQSLFGSLLPIATAATTIQTTDEDQTKKQEDSSLPIEPQLLLPPRVVGLEETASNNNNNNDDERVEVAPLFESNATEQDDGGKVFIGQNSKLPLDVDAQTSDVSDTTTPDATFQQRGDEDAKTEASPFLLLLPSDDRPDVYTGDKEDKEKPPPPPTTGNLTIVVPDPYVNETKSPSADSKIDEDSMDEELPAFDSDDEGIIESTTTSGEQAEYLTTSMESLLDEDFMEDEVEIREEILKHGEAGVTSFVPTAETAETTESLATTTSLPETTTEKKRSLPRDRSKSTLIRVFNDSLALNDKDDHASNVSSEVSINDDFVLETTLLDVNPVASNKTSVSNNNNNNGTQSSLNVQEEESEGLRELFDSSEREEPDEPELAATTVAPERQETTTIATSSRSPSSDQQRIVFPDDIVLFGVQDPVSEVQEEANEDIELPTESSLFRSSSDDDGSQSSAVRNNYPLTTRKHGGGGQHVRFPSDADIRRSQSNRVRFPLDEINSIHGRNYKARALYHRSNNNHQQQLDDSSSGASFNVYSKNSGWSTYRSSHRGRSTPSLTTFWKRVPSSTGSLFPLGETVRYSQQPTVTRRGNYYREGEQSGMFAPKVQSPYSGYNV